MKIEREIKIIKTRLREKAIKNGLWENFGQTEVRKLEDKYGYTSEVKRFDDWCMNQDYNSIKGAEK